MAKPLCASADPVVVWEALPGPQSALVTCPVFDVFYGGARGGGKTDGVLGEWLIHADKHRDNAVGLMIRRERTQLIETIERSRQIYTPLGAKLHEQEKMWRFPNGARLRFAYLEHDADAEAYQGHSYTRVYVEEIGNFPSPAPILKLMATLRSAAGVPVGFRATGNPGGPGHSWVKARYIDPAPLGWKLVTDPATGLDRVFIPSKLRDNRYLGEDYVLRLKASGSDELVRAWLEGDWGAVEGAFFDCWSTARHVIPPFPIPGHWMRFRSMDWGSASPFSVGWWTVASEATPVQTSSPSDPARLIPRGALVRYREWYGARAPNVGLKMTAEEVARGILEREGDDTENGRSLISYGVLDPAAFAQDGGPSIAERMARTGVIFRRADNRRVARVGAIGGWDQVRARMKGDLDGNPMLFLFSPCADTIRTVPIMQHDPDRPEDLMTDSDDHCLDDVRYACMSRAYIRPMPKPPHGSIDTRVPTLAELVRRTVRLRGVAEGRI
jgi:hypothetical protein